ncbi:hypothetical protein ACH5RR_006869 [Cinchona calisaya]|uniref:Uncharacterized protein n=1 Tax=Cinchona calisaya TaxID=153742 RepID=A0ABD3AQ72_9GENT
MVLELQLEVQDLILFVLQQKHQKTAEHDQRNKVKVVEQQKQWRPIKLNLHESLEGKDTIQHNSEAIDMVKDYKFKIQQFKLIFLLRIQRMTLLQQQYKLDRVTEKENQEDIQKVGESVSTEQQQTSSQLAKEFIENEGLSIPEKNEMIVRVYDDNGVLVN